MTKYMYNLKKFKSMLSLHYIMAYLKRYTDVSFNMIHFHLETNCIILVYLYILYNILSIPKIRMAFTTGFRLAGMLCVVED